MVWRTTDGHSNCGIRIGVARGVQEVFEVFRTREARDGEAEGGPEISGGISSVSKSPFWSDEGARFYGEDFLGCGILYLGLPFPDVVAGGGTGIGTGVAVLVELDKEDGTLMEDTERGSKGILVFPLNFAPTALCGLESSGVWGLHLLT